MKRRGRGADEPAQQEDEEQGKGRGKGKEKGRRRRLVHSPVVALFGLAGLAVLAVMMLRGQLDLVAAGQRAAVLLAVVLAVERLVLPACRALVGPPSAGR